MAVLLPSRLAESNNLIKFLSITSVLGAELIRTITYHTTSNSLVDRIHCQHNVAIKSHGSPNWCETLPVVLLGVRTSLTADTQYPAAVNVRQHIRTARVILCATET